MTLGLLPVDLLQTPVVATQQVRVIEPLAIELSH